MRYPWQRRTQGKGAKGVREREEDREQASDGEASRAERNSDAARGGG